MTDRRDLYIVRFERAPDGGCGDPIDCTPIRRLGGLATYPLREGIAASESRLNVAVRAASGAEALVEARELGNVGARMQAAGA